MVGWLGRVDGVPPPPPISPGMEAVRDGESAGAGGADGDSRVVEGGGEMMRTMLENSGEWLAEEFQMQNNLRIVSPSRMGKSELRAGHLHTN